MAEDRSTWISFDTAAEIADCAREILRNAVASGRIEQRTVTGRIRSLRRGDVKRIAKNLREQQRVAQALAVPSAATTDRAQNNQPPDHGHAWVDAETAPPSPASPASPDATWTYSRRTSGSPLCGAAEHSGSDATTPNRGRQVERLPPRNRDLQRGARTATTCGLWMTWRTHIRSAPHCDA